ncbi:cellulose binding domain-containing protein [Glycomyces luteolus]|uniref:cellulose binding domain-containing protein n=1 Tax=Glycomyces luteolus TaxID=2670330 RepID=UPI0038CC128C
MTWVRPGGQRITSSWNAAVTSSGANVAAEDVGRNGSIAAGRTATAWGLRGQRPEYGTGGDLHACIDQGPGRRRAPARTRHRALPRGGRSSRPLDTFPKCPSPYLPSA